jgi:hypothetical protein
MTVSYEAARAVVAWCSASARTLATRAWMRASRAVALRRLADSLGLIPEPVQFRSRIPPALGAVALLALG